MQRFFVCFKQLTRLIRMGFLVVLLLSSAVFASKATEVEQFVQTLSQEQSFLLEGFLRRLMGSFSGYVLYGDKPLAIEGHLLSDDTGAVYGIDEETPWLVKGMDFWQSLNIPAENKSHFFLIIKPTGMDYRHLLCINRKAFLRVVDENLPLFRYVLGPTLTAESLLQQLIHAKDDFYKVLKDDNVLLGILLGYGTQNSLLVSRAEFIRDAFERREDFPFISRIAQRGSSLLPKSAHKKPSLGVASLVEEEKLIKEKTVVSRRIKSFNSYAIPCFSCDPYSQETKTLLSKYEKNRKQIVKITRSKDFLEKMLLKLFSTIDDKMEVPKMACLTSLCLAYDKRQTVREFITRVHQEIEGEDYFCADFKQAFLQGVCDREKEIAVSRKPDKETGKQLYELFQIKKKLKCCENLNATISLIEKLHAQKDFIALVPHKLYYEILQQGEGKVASSKILTVTLHYSFQTVGHKEKGEGTIKGERIEHLLPGVAQAIFGMRCGEKRKLYIHPEYAYGEDSYFPPNAFIHAEIELLAFEEGEKEMLLAPPYKIQEKNYEKLLQKWRQLKKEQLYQNGVAFWDLIKKAKNFVDFATFASFFKEGCASSLREDQKESFLNDFHWHLLCYSLLPES